MPRRFNQIKFSLILFIFLIYTSLPLNYQEKEKFIPSNLSWNTLGDFKVRNVGILEFIYAQNSRGKKETWRHKKLSKSNDTLFHIGKVLAKVNNELWINSVGVICTFPISLLEFWLIGLALS